MMPRWFAGVDGCRAGWVVAFVDLNHEDIRVRVMEHFTDIFAAPEEPCLVAVDIPIGLPAHIGPQGRGPERAVRPLLGERQSSVFAVPSRGAVYTQDYREACRVALATSDPPKKVSKQLFMIAPKIREVDETLRNTPSLTGHVFEVHPEVAFWRLNGGRALPEPKKVKGRPFGAAEIAHRRRIFQSRDRTGGAVGRSHGRSSRFAGLRGDRATHPGSRRGTFSGSAVARRIRIAGGDLGLESHAAFCLALISLRLIRHSAI